MSASVHSVERRTYAAATIIHDIPHLTSEFGRDPVWRATDPPTLNLDDVVEDALTELLDVTATLTADLAVLW